jgi:mRNA-degrading endonuclease YafQ of YafQ-DinJ toxin-antitoxin module
MKILRYSTQYKRDFKRYRNQPLLIWFDRDRDTINLLRLGSHSELFR